MLTRIFRGKFNSSRAAKRGVSNGGVSRSGLVLPFLGHGEVRVYRGTGVSHGVRRTTWDRSLKNWELQIPCFEDFSGEGTLWDSSLPVSLTLWDTPALLRPHFPSPNFCSFWDFPDFSGTFPICSGIVRGFSRFVPFLFLGLLRAPTRNSPERVCNAIWTFPEKSGKPPGL